MSLIIYFFKDSLRCQFLYYYIINDKSSVFFFNSLFEIWKKTHVRVTSINKSLFTLTFYYLIIIWSSKDLNVCVCVYVCVVSPFFELRCLIEFVEIGFHWEIKATFYDRYVRKLRNWTKWDIKKRGWRTRGGFYQDKNRNSWWS